MFHLWLVIINLLFIGVIHNENCANQKVSIVLRSMDDFVNKKAEDVSWHVAIFKQDEDITFLCGGTIMQNRFVITATKCVEHVPPGQLRVAAGMSLVNSPTDAIANPHTIYTVSEKYYTLHSGAIDESLRMKSITILKLRENSTHVTPQITVLSASHHVSKNCFTLGWGYRQMEKTSNKKSVPLEVTGTLNQKSNQESYPTQRMINYRNILGLSSMFIFKATEVLNINFRQLTPLQKLSSDPVVSGEHSCFFNEYAHHKITRVSTTHGCNSLCHDSSQICLQGNNLPLLSNQVDIGSPVFCKIKTPKSEKHCPRFSQYVLAGIITDTHAELVPLLKHQTTVSSMRATNITYHSDFIFSVLYRYSF